MVLVGETAEKVLLVRLERSRQGLLEGQKQDGRADDRWNAEKCDAFWKWLTKGRGRDGIARSASRSTTRMRSGAGSLNRIQRTAFAELPRFGTKSRLEWEKR